MNDCYKKTATSYDYIPSVTWYRSRSETVGSHNTVFTSLYVISEVSKLVATRTPTVAHQFSSIPITQFQNSRTSQPKNMKNEWQIEMYRNCHENSKQRKHRERTVMM